MIIISRKIASPQQVRFAELQPGRLLHARVALDPPLDLLCVYQHAWSNVSHRGLERPSREDAQADLLSRRQGIWKAIGSWARSMPQRNSVVIGGDMNASLTCSQPHVGPGVHPHKFPHPDQAEFQRLVVSQGLIALNSWCKAGRPAGTFLNAGLSVQIDFLFTRLPCPQQSRRTRALHAAPIVHPTGMRHVPVSGYVPRPTIPRTAPNKTVRSQDVHKMLSAFPQMRHSFQHEVDQLLEQGKLENIDSCLQTAWQTCVKRHGPTAGRLESSAPVSLQAFWAAKNHLRACQRCAASYVAPLMWYIADTPARNLLVVQPRVGRKLRPLFQLWRALQAFRHQDKQLRARVKQRKAQQVDSLIQEAQELDGKGISALHMLVKRIRPRAPRRSIHFRQENGQLMTEQAEVEWLRTYFSDLFQEDHHSAVTHVLPCPITIAQWEIDEALKSMPARKALPPGHAPTVLWKTASVSVGPRLRESFVQCLQSGPLCFPQRWHDSHLTLLAKPGKQPNCPANLRPINLLPAEAKILARIAARRLRPLIAAAAQSVPQFAYIASRQCADAIDRVLSHCARVRDALKGQHRTAWRSGSAATSHGVIGGLQISLDLTKAYDRLPRHLLRSALEWVGASAELITLVLYIHDHARVIVSRHAQTAAVGMGRGVRQGCGLSPLLWIAFTLLLHHRFSSYIPAESQTSYADDFHLQWEFSTEQGCRAACQTIPRILADLQSFGMEVSLGKTVVLLAIKGPKASKILKEFTTRVKGERVFRVRTAHHKVTLPLRRTHDYLGVKIGYYQFERSTTKHRLQQSWVAMHRLHDLLKHQSIPLRKRVLLWQSCVWSVATYGLTAVGLDQRSAQSFCAGVMRQLRLVARSPAHVSHETNEQLLDRLSLIDPLKRLQKQCAQRVDQSRRAVGHLQPPRVHQWWSLLNMGFSLHHSTTAGLGVLTEVTQILRIRSSCQICGQSFPSKHALKVHIGKMHPEAQPRHEPNPTIKNRRVDEYRKFAKGGRPQCRFCLKRFYGWPQFMGHFSQNACPIYHAPPTGSAVPSTPPVSKRPATSATPDVKPSSEAVVLPRAPAPFSTSETPALAEPDPVPLFYRPSIQAVAKQGNIRKLRDAIRECNILCHCPECFQRVTKPSYLSRHAVKMHQSIRELEPSVEAWAQQRSGLSKPCQWCGDAGFSRPSMHLKTCPVLWMIGHLLGRHASLHDRGQRFLDGGHGGGNSGGSQGVRPVRSVHEEAGGVAGLPTGGPLSEILHGGKRHDGKGDGGSAEHGGRSGQEAGGAGEGDARGPTAAAEVCQGRGQGRRAGQQAGGSSDRQGPICGVKSTGSGPRSPGRHEDPRPGQEAANGELGWRQSPRPAAELETNRRVPTVASSPTRWRPGRSERGQGCQGASRAEGSGEGNGETLLKDRGRPRSDPPRPRVHPLFANRGVRKRVCNHPEVVQHCGSVEQAEGGAAGIPHESNAEHPPLQSLHRPPLAARIPRGGPHPDGEGQGQRTHRGDDVPLFAMGSCLTKPCEGIGAATGAPGGGAGGQDLAVPGHVPERGGPLPRPSSDVRSEHGRRYYPIFARRSEPHAGVPPDVDPHEPFGEKFDLALGRRDGSSSQDGPLAISAPAGPPRAGPVSDGARLAQHLVLVNHSNHCYANSVMYSLVWTQADLPQGIQCADPGLGRFMKWLTRPLQLTASASRVVELWNNKAWVNLVAAWQEPHRQHDVGEFLQFIAPRLASTFSSDAWHARQLSAIGETQVLDQGTLWPLTVNTPLAPQPQQPGPAPNASSSPVSLQKLVIQWRNQAARHALLAEPMWLPLQVSRFDAQGRKTFDSVQISSAVYLPRFVDNTLHTTSTRYHITAVIFHLGDSPQRGHYRTAFYKDGRIVGMTDDNVQPIPASDADVELVQRNCYIFILRKC